LEEIIFLIKINLFINEMNIYIIFHAIKNSRNLIKANFKILFI